MRILALAATLFALSSCGSEAVPTEPGPSVESLTAPAHLPLGTHEILSGAKELEVFAIHPYPPLIKDDGLENAPRLEGYAVISQAKVNDSKQRKEVVSTIYSGIESSDGSSAMCFKPRHGLKASAGGKVLTMLICYQCSSIRISIDDHTETILTGASGQLPLTKIWADLGLTVHTAKERDPSD